MTDDKHATEIIESLPRVPGQKISLPYSRHLAGTEAKQPPITEQRIINKPDTMIPDTKNLADEGQNIRFGMIKKDELSAIFSSKQETRKKEVCQSKKNQTGTRESPGTITATTPRSVWRNGQMMMSDEDKRTAWTDKPTTKSQMKTIKSINKEQLQCQRQVPESSQHLQETTSGQAEFLHQQQERNREEQIPLSDSITATEQQRREQPSSVRGNHIHAYEVCPDMCLDYIKPSKQDFTKTYAAFSANEEKQRHKLEKDPPCNKPDTVLTQENAHINIDETLRKHPKQSNKSRKKPTKDMAATYAIFYTQDAKAQLLQKNLKLQANPDSGRYSSSTKAMHNSEVESAKKIRKASESHNRERKEMAKLGPSTPVASETTPKNAEETLKQRSLTKTQRMWRKLWNKKDSTDKIQRDEDIKTPVKQLQPPTSPIIGWM